MRLASDVPAAFRGIPLSEQMRLVQEARKLSRAQDAIESDAEQISIAAQANSHQFDVDAPSMSQHDCIIAIPASEAPNVNGLSFMKCIESACLSAVGFAITVLQNNNNNKTVTLGFAIAVFIQSYMQMPGKVRMDEAAGRP